MFFKIQHLYFPFSLISAIHFTFPVIYLLLDTKSLNQYLIRLTKSTTELKLLNPSIPVGSTSLLWVITTWCDPVYLPVGFVCWKFVFPQKHHQVFGAVAGDWFRSTMIKLVRSLDQAFSLFLFSVSKWNQGVWVFASLRNSHLWYE